VFQANVERVMSDRKAIEALISEAYEARRKGDVDGVVTSFHHGGTFQLAAERETFDLAGAVSGHSDLRQAMTGFIANFEFVEREVVSTIVEGDQACVRSRVKVKFAPTGRTFTTEIVDLFRFKDGKIAELVEFADTAQINHMMS